MLAVIRNSPLPLGDTRPLSPTVGSIIQVPIKGVTMTDSCAIGLHVRRWMMFAGVLIATCYRLLCLNDVVHGSHRELLIDEYPILMNEPVVEMQNKTLLDSFEKRRNTAAQNSPPSTTDSLSSDATVLPTSNNTVVSVISMGDTAQSNIAERFIASVRRRGEFDGYILLLTDAAGLKKYKQTLTQGDTSPIIQYGKGAIIHQKTIVRQVWEEDMNPVDRRQRPIHYNGHMKYKRLKTVFDKYVDAYVDKRKHKDAERMRFILYLDVDNVVANPLDQLFKDYYVSVGEKLDQIGREISQYAINNSSRQSNSNFSFFSMWKEVTKEDNGVAVDFRWQGGQILQDCLFSGGYADAWRKQFDTHPKRKMDQGLLNNIVVQNFDEYRCKVIELPTDHKEMDGKAVRNHYEKLDEDMLSAPVEDLPTVVHITSRRTKELDAAKQKQFLRKVLNVGREKDSQMIAQGVIDLESIISVVNGKGQEY